MFKGTSSSNSFHSPVAESGEAGHAYEWEVSSNGRTKPTEEDRRQLPGPAMSSSDYVETNQTGTGHFQLPADAVADTSGDFATPVPVVPRAYQIEMQKKCIEAGNCIVYAPCGSGKTLVSALVASHHLKHSTCPEEFRIVFVVDQKDRIDRKKVQLEEWLKPRFHFLRTAGLSGQQATTNPLDELIAECHLIVLTADVLLNHLSGKGRFTLIPISRVNLLIMDACHYTRDKHAYNKVMGIYMTAKMNGNLVPSVLGLTSVIPTKSNMNVDEAFEHVQKLCANLDAGSVIEVTDNVTEMMAFIAAPEKQDYRAPARPTDPFTDKISQAMTTIEINVLEENPSPGIAKHGTIAYDIWANEKSERDDTKKFCARCLVQCNHALIINEDVTTQDAIQFLRHYLAETQRFASNPQKKAVLAQLQSTVDSLEETCQSTKLDRLREILIQMYREMPEARCILFTRTPYSTDVLVGWINHEADLQFLKPIRLTGTESPEEKLKITEKLRGASKLLVSSTSAVRGLRVTNCHAFVRYGVKEGEISVVHAQGEATQQDIDRLACSYVSKHEAESRKRKEKEQALQDALKRLAGLSTGIRRRQVETIQKREFQKQQRKHESTPTLNLSQLLLYCKECKQYLCRGDAVKKLKGTHRVVQSREFEERALWPKKATPPRKQTQRETFEVDGIQFVGKVTCRNCKKQVGPVVSTDDKRYPCIKLDYLVYSYNETKESASDVKMEFNKEMKRSLSETIEDL